METTGVSREIAGAAALQFLPGRHVNRTTYPDPQVFDRNGDGDFNALDIVIDHPGWDQIAVKNTPRAVESLRPEDGRHEERQSPALRAYERSSEVETEHAVEVTA